MPDIYAIDYGTSNSLLAACDHKQLIDPVSLDPGAPDPTILRSILFYPNNREVYFGSEAIKSYAEHNCEGRLFRSIKKYLPNPNFSSTSIGGKAYTLESIISTFLREMKTRADNHFRKNVTRLVLGRPARFSLDDEKDALAQKRLNQAAEMAGFTEVHFLAEPLAAAYDYRNQIESEKILLVVDLGGGTSDFTLLKINPKDKSTLDVLSMGGLSIAGDAMDGALMIEELAPYFASQVRYQLPLSKNVLTMPPHIQYKLSSAPDIALLTQEDIMAFIREVEKCSVTPEESEKVRRLITLAEDNLGFRFYEELEKNKRHLGENESSRFSFSYPDIDLELDIKKNRFDEITSENIHQIMGCLDETVRKSGFTYDHIDIVCATGGTSKMPQIKNALFERISKDKIEEFRNFHSIIQGLSRYAQTLI